MRSSLRRSGLVGSLFVATTFAAFAASAYGSSSSADADRPGIGAEEMAKVTYAILSATGMTTLGTTASSAS